jgi:hypothetical protein
VKIALAVLGVLLLVALLALLRQ